MAKTSWNDLRTGARAAIVVTGAVELGLLGAVWTDLARRSPAEVNGPRWAWALGALVNIVGPLAYVARGRRQV